MLMRGQHFFIIGLMDKDNVSFLPFRWKSVIAQNVYGKTGGIDCCLNQYPCLNS